MRLQFSFKYNHIKQKHFFHIPFRTTLHQSYSYCSFPEQCLRLLTFSRKWFCLDSLEHGTKISGIESWTSPCKLTSKTWEESLKHFFKRQVIMSISAWTMIRLITAFQFLLVQGQPGLIQRGNLFASRDASCPKRQQRNYRVSSKGYFLIKPENESRGRNHISAFASSDQKRPNNYNALNYTKLSLFKPRSRR